MVWVADSAMVCILLHLGGLRHRSHRLVRLRRLASIRRTGDRTCRGGPPTRRSCPSPNIGTSTANAAVVNGRTDAAVTATTHCTAKAPSSRTRTVFGATRFVRKYSEATPISSVRLRPMAMA